MHRSRALLPLLAGLLLAACGDSTGPSRALPTGVYSYTTTTGFVGSLTVTASNDESVTATWDVRDSAGRLAFRPDAVSIGWNIDAFVVLGQPAMIMYATHSHRLAREGDGIRCSGTHVGVGPFGCTLTRR